jgi:hypothetical protein
LANNQA